MDGSILSSIAPLLQLDALGTAVQNFLQPEVLVIVVLAAAYGIFVGAIPGLTATMAVALVIPLTYFLDPIPALAAIVTLEACAIFAGDIPTALLRIPGTPASAAYVDDAHAITKEGKPYEALGISLVSSVVGGIFGAVLLMILAPYVAKVAYEFSSYENFWLYLLGLSCAVMVSRGSKLGGAVALLIGLLLSTVGLSAVHSEPRFTFGRDELVTGVSFIPAMIGLFGVSEVLRIVLHSKDLGAATVEVPSEKGPGLWRRAIAGPARAVFGPALRLLPRRGRHLLRSGCVGSGIGMLPGAGADIAAWISYALSKRAARDKTAYGKGSREGLADATNANNSALAGAWMPALILGIPGDSVTAIVIGVLLMKNVTPGAAIVTEQPELLHGIYVTFIAANLLLLPLGFLAIRTAGAIVRVPRRVLVPVILLFSIVGSFAISGSYFDVLLMLGMGVLGYVLESRGVPLGPIVLGILLGGNVEETFVQNWTKSPNLLDFFSRPWAAALGSLTILVWLGPWLLRLFRRFERSD